MIENYALKEKSGLHVPDAGGIGSILLRDQIPHAGNEELACHKDNQDPYVPQLDPAQPRP